jgi:iron complex outermembrane recepter protein
LHNRGIDLSLSYTFDDVFGGQLRPSLDGSYILDWELDDFVIDGSTLAAGYDGIGYVNGTATGRSGQAVPEWRASFGLNYRFDIHNLNISAHFIPGITDEDTVKYNEQNSTNINAGDANGITPAACADTNPTSPPIPDGAGTGEYGGFCAGQRASLLAGKEIDDYLTIDMTYRVELPADIGVTLSVYNLLNEDPQFARTAVSYLSGFGSPLGRNYKLTLSKRF